MTAVAEEIERTTVPEMDEILGKKLNVLDDGFIRVIDYMGTDSSIVQAARVSYGAGTKQVSRDRGLIRYLMRNRHTSPFEMCELKLHIRVPMDCWRQWIRHRMANVNEYSTRYSIAIDAMRTTQPGEWRLQSDDNKQGSSGFIDNKSGVELSDRERDFHNYCRREYENRLEKGIAREQARKDLPLSTYTEAYWKIDLHNLVHFLSLRMDPHAQYEIREYARVIGEQVVARWVPLTWEAFLDYRMNAMSLSGPEVKLVSLLAKGAPEQALELAKEMKWLTESDSGLKAGREAKELLVKLEKLDIPAPW